MRSFPASVAVEVKLELCPSVIDTSVFGDIVTVGAGLVTVEVGGVAYAMVLEEIVPPGPVQDRE